MIPHLRPFLVAALLCAPAAIAQLPGLSVKTAIPLTVARDGYNGTLVLLEDERLTNELDKRLWASGGPSLTLDRKDPLYRQLTAPPLKRAVLLLMNPQKKIVGRITLQRELAILQAATLHAGYRTIMITTDLTAGFGSYSGPLTQILDLSEAKLEIATARNTFTGKSAPIYLARTLKTEWRVSADHPRPGAPVDLLEIACRPGANAPLDPAPDEFAVIRTRYHWTGTEWVFARRRAPGFWEADHEFPPIERFPRTGQPPPAAATASMVLSAKAR
jgi:hypothetical protein